MEKWENPAEPIVQLTLERADVSESLSWWGCSHVAMEGLYSLNALHCLWGVLYNIYFQKQYVNRDFHFIIGGVIQYRPLYIHPTLLFCFFHLLFLSGVGTCICTDPIVGISFQCHSWPFNWLFHCKGSAQSCDRTQGWSPVAAVDGSWERVWSAIDVEWVFDVWAEISFSTKNEE